MDSKYRGRRTDNKEFVYGLVVKKPVLKEGFKGPYVSGWEYAIQQYYPQNDLNQMYFVHAVIPETIARYTGTNDKNGEELYTGDTVQYGDAWFTGQIVWNTSELEYSIWNPLNNTSLKLGLFHEDELKLIKEIGN